MYRIKKKIIQKMECFMFNKKITKPHFPQNKKIRFFFLFSPRQRHRDWQCIIRARHTMHFKSRSWFGHLAFVHSFKASNAGSGVAVWRFWVETLTGTTAPSLSRGMALLGAQLTGGNNEGRAGVKGVICMVGRGTGWVCRVVFGA